MRITATTQMSMSQQSSSRTPQTDSLETSSAQGSTDYTTPQAPSSDNLIFKAALDELVKTLDLGSAEAGPHDLSSLCSTTASAQNMYLTEKETAPLPARPLPQPLEDLLSQSAPRKKRGRLGAPRHPHNGQFLKTKNLPPTETVASIPSPKCPATYANFAPAAIPVDINHSNSVTYTAPSVQLLSSEDLASEVFSYIIRCSGGNSSELALKVREANFNKHYKQALVSRINSILSSLPPDANSHSYKTHDSIISECLFLLGF